MLKVGQIIFYIFFSSLHDSYSERALATGKLNKQIDQSKQMVK